MSHRLRDDLWADNPALVRLLGLSPLLAVSTSVANAVGLGLATALVLTAASASAALLRRQFTDALRVPAWLVVIGGYTAAMELLLRAGWPPLYRNLGLFVPLIAANGAVLAQLQDRVQSAPPLAAARAALTTGAGFAVALILVGALRELVGAGTLFADMDTVFGPAARHWRLEVAGGEWRFPLLLLPPGGFILVGLLIALKNRIDARSHRSRPAPVPGAQRVRTTGRID